MAVDIRGGSPTFGRWVGVVLSAENKRQLYVPPGFAHGFVVTSEAALFSYKCTDFYAPMPKGPSCGTIPASGYEWPVRRAVALGEGWRGPAATTRCPREACPDYRAG